VKPRLIAAVAVAIAALFAPSVAVAVKRLTPLDGETVDSAQPAFTWTLAPDEAPYEIWIASSPVTDAVGFFLAGNIVTYGSLV
jgi:hypothetical protein